MAWQLSGCCEVRRQGQLLVRGRLTLGSVAGYCMCPSWKAAAQLGTGLCYGRDMPNFLTGNLAAGAVRRHALLKGGGVEPLRLTASCVGATAATVAAMTGQSLYCMPGLTMGRLRHHPVEGHAQLHCEMQRLAALRPSSQRMHPQGACAGSRGYRGANWPVVTLMSHVRKLYGGCSWGWTEARHISVCTHHHGEEVAFGHHGQPRRCCRVFSARDRAC